VAFATRQNSSGTPPIGLSQRSIRPTWAGSQGVIAGFTLAKARVRSGYGNTKLPECRFGDDLAHISVGERPTLDGGPEYIARLAEQRAPALEPAVDMLGEDLWNRSFVGSARLRLTCLEHDPPSAVHPLHLLADP